jgi:hypothetical protein
LEGGHRKKKMRRAGGYQTRRRNGSASRAAPLAYFDAGRRAKVQNVLIRFCIRD